MTTRTKLNITSFVASTMMFLNVFSKPLHIPQGIQWVLILGVFVPLALVFRYIKILKQEQAIKAENTVQANGQQEDAKRKVRKRLLLMMVAGGMVSLACPFW